MKFNPGQDYFYYSESIGMVKLVFIYHDPKTNKYVFDKNRTYFGSDLSVMHETEDLALIHFYKEGIKEKLNNLDFYQKKLNLYKHELTVLYNKQKPLKEKYPEEYI